MHKDAKAALITVINTTDYSDTVYNAFTKLFLASEADFPALLEENRQYIKKVLGKGSWAGFVNGAEVPSFSASTANQGKVLVEEQADIRQAIERKLVEFKDNAYGALITKLEAQAAIIRNELAVIAANKTQAEAALSPADSAAAAVAAIPAARISAAGTRAAAEKLVADALGPQTAANKAAADAQLALRTANAEVDRIRRLPPAAAGAAAAARAAETADAVRVQTAAAAREQATRAPKAAADAKTADAAAKMAEIRAIAMVPVEAAALARTQAADRANASAAALKKIEDAEAKIASIKSDYQNLINRGGLDPAELGVMNATTANVAPNVALAKTNNTAIKNDTAQRFVPPVFANTLRAASSGFTAEVIDTTQQRPNLPAQGVAAGGNSAYQRHANQNIKGEKLDKTHVLRVVKKFSEDRIGELEQDATHRVTDKSTQNLKTEDRIEVALEQAKMLLINYDPELGDIIISAEHPINSYKKDMAARVHAALLYLTKDIPLTVKIICEVPGVDKPSDGKRFRDRFKGVQTQNERNDDFIKSNLGSKPGDRGLQQSDVTAIRKKFTVALGEIKETTIPDKKLEVEPTRNAP